MKRTALTGTFLGGVLVAMVSVTPASAQATRTWVSGVGDDANPCSRTAPCKTFAGAISKTAAGGEINCLDPGGFGGVTIGKALTIRCDHVEAGVLVSGTNAIIVNLTVATDRVTLEGLDIEGLGTGLDGVKMINVGKLYIIRCAIRAFTGNGVNMTGNGAHAFISDSIIYKNGGGVNVTGTNNIASLTNTQVLSNTSFAVQANGAGDIVTLQTSTLNDTNVSISLLNGGTSIGVGPSNLLSGSGTISSQILFK